MNDTTEFWRGDFGDQYSQRNTDLVESYTAMWANILARTEGVKSILELGCGTGMNLEAIRGLGSELLCHGIEANKTAALFALRNNPEAAIFNASILAGHDPYNSQYDLVFTRGVLIHIEPKDLPAVYSRMVSTSNRYVMVAEYFNPTPVEIPYRGHAGKLWKRDFAGDLMDRHNLKLVDYGFLYNRGPFPQDNVTWFLMEKQ